MKIALLNMTSVVFAFGAVYVASKGVDGFGWLIFGSVMTFVYPKKIKD